MAPREETGNSDSEVTPDWRCAGLAPKRTFIARLPLIAHRTLPKGGFDFTKGEINMKTNGQRSQLTRSFRKPTLLFTIVVASQASNRNPHMCRSIFG
jgi:hypothetical protein